MNIYIFNTATKLHLQAILTVEITSQMWTGFMAPRFNFQDGGIHIGASDE